MLPFKLIIISIYSFKRRRKNCLLFFHKKSFILSRLRICTCSWKELRMFWMMDSFGTISIY